MLECVCWECVRAWQVPPFSEARKTKKMEGGGTRDETSRRAWREESKTTRASAVQWSCGPPPPAVQSPEASPTPARLPRDRRHALSCSPSLNAPYKPARGTAVAHRPNGSGRLAGLQDPRVYWPAAALLNSSQPPIQASPERRPRLCAVAAHHPSRDGLCRAAQQQQQAGAGLRGGGGAGAGAAPAAPV